MSTELHHLSDYNEQNVPDASNMCFGVVVAEWNPEITGALLDGTVRTLEKQVLSQRTHIKTVPGSFELIYGAQQMTKNEWLLMLSLSSEVLLRVRLLTSIDICQGGYLWYRTFECIAKHPCYLWSSHHKRFATSKGSKRWKTWKQG